jgi:TonB-linked SusC/RagA family outer membrane protein
MYSFYSKKLIQPPYCIRKVFLVMKITTLILFVAIMQVSATTLAQKVSLKANNQPLSTIFDQISSQTGYDFAYTTKTLQSAKLVTINVKNGEINDVLQKIFQDQPLEFTIKDKFVSVTIKQPSLLDKIKSALNLDKIGVTGRVVDENNQPLSGATVIVKDGNNSTTTDAGGFFTLREVDQKAVIVISFIGYGKTEFPAAANMGTLRLKAATNPLDEVQVIAYGQTTQRLSVGNISSISAKQIEEQPVANPLLALEGQVSGLFITQSNGISGGGVTVRIQGQNSIAEGNDPLYVIDGVPYISQVPSTVTGGVGSILGNSNGTYAAGGGGNPLSYLNPDDIESIEVLKDASATAIYGSRAANGAILITTKRGKPGQTKVDVNLQQGWGQDTRRLDLLNTQQYIQMRLEGLRNDGIAGPSSTDYDLNGLWDQSRYTNWQKVLDGGTAHYSDYNASVSGGSATTQFLVSSTFHREGTVFPGDYSDEKGSVHFNLNNSSVNQRFHFTFSGNYLSDNNQLPAIDFTNTSLVLAPDAPALYNPDGTLNWELNSSGAHTWTNPLNVLYTNYQNKTNNLIANSVISYQVLPGLEIMSSFGYNYLTTNEFSDLPLNYNPPENRATSTRTAYYTNSIVSSWIIEPQLHYKRAFGNGKVDFLLGTTMQEMNTNGYDLMGSGYTSDQVLQDIQAASTITSGSSVLASTYKYQAVFSRLNYNWKDKYIIDIAIRRDGSSRFGPENQDHNFGSIGGAWVFSEEKWLKNNLGFLSFGKLKLSYGTTGNDQIGDYQYMNLYKSTTAGVPYQGTVGLTPSGLPNSYLQWEETRKLQAGIDLGFFNDRLLFSGDYSRDRSSNELLSYALPSITGFGSINENFPATVQNKDWEFNVTSVNVTGKDFKWSTNINFTIPQNKVISFPNIALSSYASGTNGVIIGQPIGIIKTLHSLGVDPATGAYVFEDSHGNPTSTPNLTTDETTLINTNPKYYGGIGNTFSYKGFELEFFFQGVKQTGISRYSITNNGNEPGTKAVNQSVAVLNAWQEPGDISSIERFNTNSSLFIQALYAGSSDLGYTDASYIRLKNLSLSWNLPKEWQQRAHLQNARIYIQGQNLLTITKYPGLDPETQTSGLPPLRVITVGMRVSL